MKKIISNILFFLFLSSTIVACSGKVEDVNGSKQEVISVNVYKQELDNGDFKLKLLFTLQKEQNKYQLKKFIKAANEVKYQTSRVDMPPSDYTLKFVLSNNNIVSYSLWLNPKSESGFIMKNPSHFTQLNQHAAKELLKIIKH